MSHTIPKLLIAVMAVSGQAMAQSGLSAAGSDSLMRNARLTSLPIAVDASRIYSVNPATMPYRDSISLSDIRLKGEYSDLQKAVMEQLGTGYTGMSISAESYRHLTPATTVWGEAAFTTGKTKDVRWSNCIDYLKVAPYVLGDEVGGDLSSRKYTFAGGYSGRFSRWTAGVSADYRAEIAYRDRDPRVKTVVSDLNVSLGTSYLVTRRYVLGVNGGINIYNQNCDLDFYNPMNDINTYTLTGLGTYYQRFMGNTNKNSGYQSLGLNASIQFVSTDKDGFMGNVVFRHYRMEQQLRNFNNLTLGFSDVNTISAQLAYKFRFGNAVTFQPAAEGLIRSHKGTENLFGTSAGASYDKIGSRSIYRHNAATGKLSLPLQIRNGHTYYTVSPYIGYDFDRERYLEPVRELQASHLITGMSASISAISGKWMWDAGIDGNYAKASAKTPILTGLETDTPLGQCVISNFDMLKADRTSLLAKISAGRVISGILFDITLSYCHTRYTGEGNGNFATLSIGARF